MVFIDEFRVVVLFGVIAIKKLEVSKAMMLDEAIRNLEYSVSSLEEKMERLEQKKLQEPSANPEEKGSGVFKPSVNEKLVAQKLDNAIQRVESILKAGQLAAQK